MSNIFPTKQRPIFEEANETMVANANRLGMYLVVVLVIIFILLLAGMYLFFRTQQQQVEAANNAKTTFLFNMPHDIRTPMNAIIGYAALARKHIDDTALADDYLSKIDISGKQLLTLVNQVLDMSRIESGRVVLEDNPIDIIERSNAMLTIMEATAVEKGVHLVGNINTVTDRYVYADTSRMSQIVLNILGNAVKYTPEGGSVTFTLEQCPCNKPCFTTYSLSVTDTGIGMSREFLKHIFDPFTRETTSTITKIEGTGLGMAIVKRLTDLMGGTLEIDSSPGH